MQMKALILTLVCLVYLSPILGAEPCDSLHTLSWLLGDWKTAGEKNSTIESWKQVSTKTFEGRGETRVTATNKLLASESLRMVEMSGAVFYVPKVEHNDLPVAFKLTECSESSLVFENAGHDFPKRLEYRRIGEDQMVVVVTDGGDKGFQLEFFRQEDK